MSRLVPFYDALDVSREPANVRELIMDVLVPGLLTRLSESGLDVLVGRDLALVQQFQEKQRDMPLFSLFNTECQPSANEQDTLAIMVMRGQAAVAHIAARLKWVETTLGRELGNLSLQYEDRSTIPDGEICCVAPAVGQNIQSCFVAFPGAAYVVEHERKQGIYRALNRLLGILLLSAWRWSWQATLMTKDNTFDTGTSCGYQHFQAGVYRKSPGQNIKDREYWLAAGTRIDMRRQFYRPRIADVNRPLSLPTDAELLEAHADARGTAR